MAALDQSSAMVSGQLYTFWFNLTPSAGNTVLGGVAPTGNDVQAALANDPAGRFLGANGNIKITGPGNLACTFTWNDPTDDALGAPLSVSTAGQSAASVVNNYTSVAAIPVTFVEGDAGDTQSSQPGASSLLWILGGVLVVAILLIAFGAARGAEETV